MGLREILTQLQAQVGSAERIGQWILVDQHRIDLFADATGDHQWIHVDATRARKDSPYGETIAHGFLTLSMLSALTKTTQGEESPYAGSKLSVNYGLNKVRFPAPVKVNSRIRARTRFKEVTEVSGALQIIREITVEVEGQDKPACVAETLTRIYF
ncbi:MAG: MaoC family dehydratase [Deltaproteobacteria bacterium]|nr:MaoC family dehydratase [Deltaproteobacteria bacterium]